MNEVKKSIRVLMVLTIPIICSCQSLSDKKEGLDSNSGSTYANVLDIKGIPADPKDRSIYTFSDLGAWHSYGLSPRPSGGFVGPYLMTDDNGLWSSKQLVALRLKVGERILDWQTAEMIKSEYWPGRLVQVYRIESFTVTQQLIFISNRSTLVQFEIETDKKQPKVIANFNARSWLKNWDFSIQTGQLLLDSDNSQTQVILTFDTAVDGSVDGAVFMGQDKEFDLNPNFPVKMTYVQSSYFSEKEKKEDAVAIKKALANPKWAFANNTKRWNEYLSKTFSKNNGQTIDSTYKHVAVKSLNTLINNWRSAAGELKHDGLFPSYAYGGFHGFWAWDSWKHSVGLADIVPELAKDQILAMYDYQDMDGMIADCIFRDTLIEKHNWRDTKPPLSGWAIAKVFEATLDTAFVSELYPKLKKYHQWWYNFRDHDSNGLCEYGSTDGTRVAAAWESGMDNAVRFDEAVMLDNEGEGFSLDQESVDLNAYLFVEKIYMAQLSNMLGKSEEAAQLKKEAHQLAERIRTRFYSEEQGFFFDVMLDNKVIDIYGPEGWIALWAGLATEEQAKAVVAHIMNETKFNTKVPLPTLDASHPKFNPKNGYWRGPVWLDQVYFAIRGLENYGYESEAIELKRKLFENAEGLLGNEPIRENYHPITGEGLNAKHFSWSAAHLLMLIRE